MKGDRWKLRVAAPSSFWDEAMPGDCYTDWRTGRLWILLPNQVWWTPDKQASNCPEPEGADCYCWERVGTVPSISILHKPGHPGAGSIGFRDRMGGLTAHYFIQDGWIVED